MQSFTLILLAAILSVALAAGQYYVPRSYYIIDAEGHESAPVPLRRLRRSLNPYPYAYPGGANANANAEAKGWADSTANANAQVLFGTGGWDVPAGGYGSANPNTLMQ